MYVSKSEKLFLIIQNGSISNYRCHAIKYSCPKKLVLKSFLDTILQPRSVCIGKVCTKIKNIQKYALRRFWPQYPLFEPKRKILGVFRRRSSSSSWRKRWSQTIFERAFTFLLTHSFILLSVYQQSSMKYDPYPPPNCQRLLLMPFRCSTGQ